MRLDVGTESAELWEMDVCCQKTNPCEFIPCIICLNVVAIWKIQEKKIKGALGTGVSTFNLNLCSNAIFFIGP